MSTTTTPIQGGMIVTVLLTALTAQKPVTSSLQESMSFFKTNMGRRLHGPSFPYFLLEVR
jgi:hypothetical protein